MQECQNQLQVSASPHLQAHLRSCSRMSHCLSHWQPQPAHTTMWDAARRGVWGPKHPEARRFGAPSTPRPSPAWMPGWVGAGPGVSGVCSGMRGAGTPWYHTPYDLAGADEVPAVPAAGAGVHHLAGGGDPLHQPPRLHHHHQILGHRRQEPLPGGELRAPAPSIPAGSSHTAPCSPLQPPTASYSPTQPPTPGPCRGAPTASPAPPGPWWLIPHT